MLKLTKEIVELFPIENVRFRSLRGKNMHMSPFKAKWVITYFTIKSPNLSVSFTLEVEFEFTT